MKLIISRLRGEKFILAHIETSRENVFAEDYSHQDGKDGTQQPQCN